MSRLTQLLLGACLMVASCKKAEPVVDAGVLPPAPKAPDHLAPGELVPGETVVFGLPLPRGVAVVAHTSHGIVGNTYDPPEHVANYFRARVADGRIQVGTAQTQFLRVRAKTDPSRVLDIRVEAVKSGTHVEVEDVTAPPTDGPVPTSNSEAFKRAGLTPDGKPSPKMLQ
jgi:hypothetical protein